MKVRRNQSNQENRKELFYFENLSDFFHRHLTFTSCCRLIIVASCNCELHARIDR